MPSILNSDDGVVSGTSGLKSTGGNDGITAFQQNGTERMRITSAGNIGIGTASPTSGGSWTYVTVAGKSTTQGGVVEVYNSDSTLKGQLYAYNGTINLNAATNHPLVFSTNNAESMRINAGTGILCLTGGNTSATGTGIAFPATQSASSDANTLDDYEEGTWTPSLGGNTTYTNQEGTYTKVGRQVTVRGKINVNTIGTGSTYTLSGMPFSAATNYMGSVYWGNSPSSLVYATLLTNADTTATIYSATGATGTLSNNAVWGSGCNVVFTVTYFV